MRLAPTNQVGFRNRNGHEVEEPRPDNPGTDHNSFAVRLVHRHDSPLGLPCGFVFWANNTDVHQRKCPRCQGGVPGLQV